MDLMSSNDRGARRGEPLEPTRTLRRVVHGIALAMSAVVAHAQEPPTSSAPAPASKGPHFELVRKIEGSGNENARPRLCRSMPSADGKGRTLVLVDEGPWRTSWFELDTGRELRSVAWKVDVIDASSIARLLWVPDVDGDGEDDIVAECLWTQRSPGHFTCFSALAGTPLWCSGPKVSERLAESVCSLRLGDDIALVVVERAPDVDDPSSPSVGSYVVRGIGARNGASSFTHRIESGAKRESHEWSGPSASAAATDDSDGDGREDLLLGLRSATGPDGATGRALVVSSATGKTLRELACGVDLTGWSKREVGANVRSIPDLDGDGRHDFAVTYATQRVVPITEGKFAGGTSQQNLGFIDVLGSKTGALIRRLEIPDEQDRLEGFGRRVIPIGFGASSRMPSSFVVSHPLATGPTGGNGALELYDGRTGKILDVRQGARDGAYLGDPLEVIARGDDVLVLVGAEIGPWEILRIAP